MTMLVAAIVRLAQSSTSQNAPDDDIQDLAERAVIELDHLLSFAPRMSSCRLCGRVFVVRGKRAGACCRQYLWLASPPRRFIERCATVSRRVRTDSQAASSALRRALAKHDRDAGHPDVRDALATYSASVTSEPSSPHGRRPVPRPAFVTNGQRVPE
jgi:hypothetical protein